MLLKPSAHVWNSQGQGNLQRSCSIGVPADVCFVFLIKYHNLSNDNICSDVNPLTILSVWLLLQRLRDPPSVSEGDQSAPKVVRQPPNKRQDVEEAVIAEEDDK